MKVIVPGDHGATDILSQASDSIVVRPRHYDGDTYVPLWYYFQAVNDTGHRLEQARIIIEGLAPGADTYQPFWKHSVWSRDGKHWEHIPEVAKDVADATLTIVTPLDDGDGLWVASTFPLPYRWYEYLCHELAMPATAASSGWNLERRKIGSSVEGRPIYAFHVQLEAKRAKRNLLIVAGQHAVEESGKIFAESTLRGYHSGRFRGTLMEELLKTHNVTVVPLANPDGCYHGRMNSNAEGVVMDSRMDNSVETKAILALIDELQPHVLVNCHGWGNEVGELPYEDIYRFNEDDPLFLYLQKHVPGCNSSGNPHLFRDDFRLESHARYLYGTECTITELNFHWFMPLDGSAPRQPTRADIEARTWQYLAAIAGFCIEDSQL